MAELLLAFTDGITDATPIIAGVFGAVIGLAFIFAVGGFIVRKVRGTVS